MKVETKIHLNKFQPREYQSNFIKAFQSKKFKKFLLVWPRRAGKDLCCFNLLVQQAIFNVGVYFYLLPTFSQARRVIFDSITNTGERFLDYIPRELITSVNSQEMKIKLVNGSVIQLLGSDTYDTSLVGTNPKGIIWSEYALADNRSYQFARPILAANNGFCILISTPRGKNHLWELYNIAQNFPEDWFVEKLTLDETQHIPMSEVERERAEGIMSDDLISQEYYTSFQYGVEGAYYAKYLDKLRLNNQIGSVPWESALRVNTAWDIGVRDSTSIIFYQIAGMTIRIIDYYETSKQGLEHYVNVVNSKPYTYGKHFGPHDLAVTEWGSGISRIEKAKDLGLKFEVQEGRSVVPNVSVEDGIECVRSNFSKMWIDEINCKQLIKALENYRQEFDIKRQVYKPQPLHNFASHGADALRYMCLSLPKTRDGLTAKELDQRWQQSQYGNQANIPRFFRDDNL
jgi:hypothetical protein